MRLQTETVSGETQTPSRDVRRRPGAGPGGLGELGVRSGGPAPAHCPGNCRLHHSRATRGSPPAWACRSTPEAVGTDFYGRLLLTTLDPHPRERGHLEDSTPHPRRGRGPRPRPPSLLFSSASDGSQACIRFASETRVSLPWAHRAGGCPGGSGTNTAVSRSVVGWCVDVPAQPGRGRRVTCFPGRGHRAQQSPTGDAEGQQDRTAWSLFLSSNAMHIPHLKAISSFRKDDRLLSAY